MRKQIICRGLFGMSIMFVLLGCFFSPDYFRGTVGTISNGTIMAVVLSLLSLIGSLLSKFFIPEEYEK